MKRQAIEDKLIGHLLEREGCRSDVYRDSRGFLTVGIGHLVVPEDRLRFGDRISDEKILKFLRRDMAKAIDAAIAQAKDLGRKSPAFLVALASVNYQLGTQWHVKKFPKSYALLQRGAVSAVIRNLENSLWMRQTPVRVNDFIAAIRKEYGVT